ncbi:uncharacterized protein STEHIDRAFT_111181 [Stereum hirsutum FP-91666 SS1]|uniref:uncharacterized protein n=1 Tax=Stereum hirsutum (strain FP-91666) TaxID=721885 RepID=UPI000440C822|nr:uncharacterized protein STEHIDRAFT_111181 [Stereum hirsutum FP-91666 SS1]EIM86739.1 hypothetical protein STEHIDRAFT_111181 [Stereum hirsutum FP-91666 SS1]
MNAPQGLVGGTFSGEDRALVLFRLSLTGNGAFRDVWLPNRPLHQRLFIARAGTSQEETGALPTMPFWLRTTTDQGILIFHGAHGPAHFSLPHELNIWHPLGSSRPTAMLCIWVPGHDLTREPVNINVSTSQLVHKICDTIAGYLNSQDIRVPGVAGRLTPAQIRLHGIIWVSRRDLMPVLTIV